MDTILITIGAFLCFLVVLFLIIETVRTKRSLSKLNLEVESLQIAQASLLEFLQEGEEKITKVEQDMSQTQEDFLAFLQTVETALLHQQEEKKDPVLRVFSKSNNEKPN